MAKNEGDYISFEQYQGIMKKEKDLTFKLVFKLMWELGLRVGEIVGTVIQNPDYPGKNPRWIRSLPGLIPEDIDRVKAKDLGLPCKHTIHIHRKRHKEEDLPLSDKLYQEIKEYQKGRGILPNTPLLPVHRSTVYVRLTKYGRTVSSKKPIHPHSLRRGMGVYETTVKGTPVQELQALYGHTQLSMTYHYIGMQRIEALKSLARRRQSGV